MHVGYPFGVSQIPLYSFADAGLKRFGKFPSQLAFELARVKGVAPVVARAVGDLGDLGGVARAVGFGAQLVEQAAHGVDDLDVELFVPAAGVVGLAQLAFG